MNKRLVIALVALLLLAGLGLYFFKGSAGPKLPSPNANSDAPTVMVTRGPPRQVKSRAPTQASGTVVDAQGGPVAGALVILSPLEGAEPAAEGRDDQADPLNATTNDKGEFSFEAVRAGRYALAATAPGFLPGQIDDLELLAQDPNAGLSLTLATGGQLFRGKVLDVTGGVVAGAFVSVTPLRGLGFGPSSGAAGFAVRSDAQGDFAMQVPSGRHRVLARHVDYSPQRVVLSFTEGTRERNFELSPMSVLEGQVQVEGSGAPVPGALVALSIERDMRMPGGRSRTSMEPYRQVVADAQGHFVVRGLQSGTLQLHAAAAQLASTQGTTIDLGIAEQRDDLVLKVAAAKSLRGRVHQKGQPDQPIVGTQIEVMGGGGMRMSGLAGVPSVQSDEQGRFTLHGLHPGAVHVSAMAEGYLPNIPGTRVELGAGEPPELVLELDAGLALRGRVEPPGVADIQVKFDPGGMAFSIGGGLGGGGGLGADVMNLATSAGTRSKPDGSFELAPLQPGSLTVVAQAADGRAGEARVELGPDGAPEVVIQLEARASFAGVVRDSQGQAVADATVSLRPKSRPKTGGMSMTVIVNGQDLGASSSPSAQDGSFFIAGLDAGDYQVSVTAPGLGTLAWATPPDAETPNAPLPLRLSQGQQVEGHALVVQALNGRISGRVLTAEGQGAADVWVTPTLEGDVEGQGPQDEAGEGAQTSAVVMMVSASDDGASDPKGALPRTLTDAEGRFAFTRLAQGSYTLAAQASGGGGRVQRRGVKPNADITMRLAPMASIRASVSGQGLKVEGATVSATGPTTRRGVVRGGSVELNRLEPGRYQLEVASPDGSHTRTVTLEAGEVHEVDIELQALLHLRGRVVDQAGSPIANANVMIGGGGPPREAGADEGPQEMRMELSLELDSEDGAGQRTDEEGKFDITVASGMRVLVITAPNLPMPIIIKPVQVGEQDLDLGELRQGDMPAGVMGGPSAGPPPEQADAPAGN